MKRIILPLALLFVAMLHPALAESARVGGTIDCSSGWCSPKHMEIVGTIDSSTFEKFKRLIDSVHAGFSRERRLTVVDFQLNCNPRVPGSGRSARLAAAVDER